MGLSKLLMYMIMLALGFSPVSWVRTNIQCHIYITPRLGITISRLYLGTRICSVLFTNLLSQTVSLLITYCMNITPVFRGYTEQMFVTFVSHDYQRSLLHND